MGIGRRAFLQFIGGTIAGTLLSPLPWRLAEDTAIWTQNWSWRPSPERGDISEVVTICQFCRGSCRLSARLVNGHRAIMLKGANAGGICPLGASGLQFLYAPYRISQPLRQTVRRGEPRGFKPISWKEAIAELTDALRSLIDAGKPYSLALITGQNASSMFQLWKQFFTAYGSPNFFSMPDWVDSQKMASFLMFGQEAPISFALERATYVLSFGAGLLEGWGSPVRMHALYNKWNTETPGMPRTKIIQIDPRASLSASKAHRWVAINPGTEPLLALAIAHVLITSQLYDKDFVSNWVFGFDKWTDESGIEHKGFKDLVIENYSPDRVSEKVGIPPKEIEDLAMEFGRQKHAVAIWGRGKGDNPECVYHDMAFMALNLLVGNFRPDGLISLAPQVPLGPLPEIPPRESSFPGFEEKRLDLVDDEGSGPPFAGNAVHSFLDAISKRHGYTIDLLLVHEANPAYCLEENSLYLHAIEEIPKVVSFSSYMDETAALADLILPNHCVLERWDDVIGVSPLSFACYTVSAPILKPQLDTRHTGDLLINIAKKVSRRLAKALPWKGYEEFLRYRVKGLAASRKGAVFAPSEDELGRSNKISTPNYRDDEDLWGKLASGFFWYDVPDSLLNMLKTPSGKIELACQAIKLPPDAAKDILYVPHFLSFTPSGSEEKYPLFLSTYQILTLSDGYFPNPPFMNKLLPDDLLRKKDLFVDINPATARRYGLEEGSRVRLRTPRGEAVVRVHITSAARPGWVFIVKGLGHTAYDEYIAGKGVNANNLIEVQLDPLTGVGISWVTRAQLQKL